MYCKRGLLPGDVAIFALIAFVVQGISSLPQPIYLKQRVSDKYDQQQYQPIRNPSSYISRRRGYDDYHRRRNKQEQYSSSSYRGQEYEEQGSSYDGYEDPDEYSYIRRGDNDEKGEYYDDYDGRYRYGETQGYDYRYNHGDDDNGRYEGYERREYSNEYDDEDADSYDKGSDPGPYRGSGAGSVGPNDYYSPHRPSHPMPYVGKQQQTGPPSSTASAGAAPANKTAGTPDYAALCDFSVGGGPDLRITGRLLLTQNKGKRVRITGKIENLTNGKHGFHVHYWGDFSDQCESAGVHYNPLQEKHGALRNAKKDRHLGDLGNVLATRGVATIDIIVPFLTLEEGGQYPISGRSLVVHEKPDDLGRGGDLESTRNGNSGKRLRCCKMYYVDPTKVTVPKIENLADYSFVYRK